MKPSLLWNLALKLLRPSTMNTNCHSRSAVAAALAGFVSRLGLKLHAIAALALWSCLPAAAASPLIFSCSADNDLFRVASQNGLEPKRFDSPQAAIEAAGEGDGVLLLGRRRFHREPRIGRRREAAREAGRRLVKTPFLQGNVINAINRLSSAQKENYK